MREDISGDGLKKNNDIKPTRVVGKLEKSLEETIKSTLTWEDFKAKHTSYNLGGRVYEKFMILYEDNMPNNPEEHKWFFDNCVAIVDSKNLPSLADILVSEEILSQKYQIMDENLFNEVLNRLGIGDGIEEGFELYQVLFEKLDQASSLYDTILGEIKEVIKEYNSDSTPYDEYFDTDEY